MRLAAHSCTKGAGWRRVAGGPWRAGLDAGETLHLRRPRARAPVARRQSDGRSDGRPRHHRFGTPEQKNFYLPRILSGEDYWCQGYSEPGSGSDLASLRTRAVRDGDDYVINGSKIWTTHAHHANRMFALGTHQREARQQDGISFILIDMKTPGHHDAADPHHRRRSRGQPGVLRRRARAGRQPRRRGRARAGPTASICWSSSAAPASPPQNCATR